jgi:uncharacterized protein (UPF0303 family)
MKRGCDMEDLKELQIKCEEQEATYQFSSFSRDDAWLLGGMLIDAAKGYDGGVAVGIVLNGLKVFQFVTEGATRHNTQWLDRKVNLVTQFHKSSLHVYADFELKGITLEGERLDPMEFAMCGGGFPLTVKGVGVVGAIAVSGLPHLEDHQVIIDALPRWFSLRK